ncbi:MAG: TonB C-terminal domain-containing protein [Elusimicrobiota bacterium]|nr:TonB C-terminal domain-containing protein [Elusimicrobiota bacterium]
MNWPLLYSSGIHLLAFLLLFFCLGQNATKPQAVYTIDFIGASSNQPVRYGEPKTDEAAAKAAAPAKSSQSEIKTPPVAKKEEAKKPAKTQYNSKEQISKKPKRDTKAQAAKKAEPKKEEKVVLKKPSILGEVESSNIDPGSLHSMGEANEGPGGKAVRASFTNFPYPWYITQVRNSLWREWSKRMPKRAGLSTLVSFNIDKYGAVYGVQIERSSGNDSYDYAATSAANNSAPYPPLPQDFPKDVLTVTVEFKNEE